MKKIFAFIFGFFLIFGIVGRVNALVCADSCVKWSTQYVFVATPTATAKYTNSSLGDTSCVGPAVSVNSGTVSFPNGRWISYYHKWFWNGLSWVDLGGVYTSDFDKGPLFGVEFTVIATSTLMNAALPSGCTSPHCSDGVLNEGEEGIDCGGTCPQNICTPVCPPGTQLLTNSDGGCPGLPVKTGCWHRVPKDRYGSCPAGYINTYDACGRDPSLPFDCIAIKDPVLAADPNQPLDPLADPWSGNGVTSSETSETLSTPNGIGGVDETTTKTTTDSDGNTKTETTTVSKDATGKEVSRETETTETAPNVDTEVPHLTGDDFDNSMPDEFNKSVSFGLDDRLVNHSSLASIGATRLTVDSQNSIVDFSYNGHEIYFDMNQGYIVSALETIGNLLFFISLIGSFFIMFGGRD